MKDIKCDWCKSTDYKKVGEEYNGYAIMVCNDCSHEWVEGSVINKEKNKEYVKGCIGILEQMKKNKG